MASHVLLLGLLAISCSIALTSAETPLQDFCVADLTSNVVVNGFVCKNPSLVDANDFLFSGLQIKGNTTNALGSAVSLVSVSRLPGLNTLGIAMARIDYARGGVIPPHTHPRATEIFTVIKGTIDVGFVTSANILLTKVLNEGDVYVFPQGLVHYQRNVGHGHAVAIVGLSSENPGVISIPNNLFGSKPAIPTDVLEKSFQVRKTVVEGIESKF
ncbi:hypothetical protein RHGRI_036857 [Rhododendron griersonianum]|uniref:Germin-like protein n=1 Tax=Rhododendron griersonianum TaxID=479676 RepID=A0AAV6HPP7_9ERIC|nr:hypothetical protein RHGRI_036857 [Rhododendron griersonianum]